VWYISEHFIPRLVDAVFSCARMRQELQNENRNPLLERKNGSVACESVHLRRVDACLHLTGNQLRDIHFCTSTKGAKMLRQRSRA
jgi:hypothetical protein